MAECDTPTSPSDATVTSTFFEDMTESEFEEQYSNKVFDLVTQFLDLEQPRVTSYNTVFLEQPTVFETVLRVMARADSETNPPNFPPDVSLQSYDLTEVPPSRDESDPWNKRATNAMNLLTGSDPPFLDMIACEPALLVASLEDCFRPYSNANLHCVKAVLTDLFREYTADIDEALLYELLVDHNILPGLLENLHLNPVNEMVITLLQCGMFSNWGSERRSWFAYCGQQLHSIMPKLLFDPKVHPRWIEVATGIMLRIVDEIASVQDSDACFEELFTASFITKLRDFSLDESIDQQHRIQLVSILSLCFVKSGIELWDTGVCITTRPKKVDNGLSGCQDRLHDICVAKFKDFCDVIVRLDSTHMEGEKRKRFTVHHLELFQIIYEMVKFSQGELLDLMNQRIWQVLCDWLLEYYNCNVFSNTCLPLFELAIALLHTTALSHIVSDSGFAKRILAHYNDPTFLYSGLRGFIVAFCAQLTSIIPECLTVQEALESIEGWSEFSDAVMNQYLVQQTPIHPLPNSSFDLETEEEEEEEDDEVLARIAKSLLSDLTSISFLDDEDDGTEEEGDDEDEDDDDDDDDDEDEDDDTDDVCMDISQIREELLEDVSSGSDTEGEEEDDDSDGGTSDSSIEK